VLARVNTGADNTMHDLNRYLGESSHSHRMYFIVLHAVRVSISAAVCSSLQHVHCYFSLRDFT
jgi:hypothetical protein